MLILGAIVIGASDTVRATRFWSAALGLTAHAPKADDGFTDLFDKEGRLQLSIQHSDDTAPDRPRLHLDLYAPDGPSQNSEVERLLSLGGHRVDWQYPVGADFVVLADTEGNRFCVIDNAKAPEGFRLNLGLYD